jgi:hypothetical protein
MAFYNEEYSKACRLWIDNNGEFYRHFTDAVKQLVAGCSRNKNIILR